MTTRLLLPGPLAMRLVLWVLIVCLCPMPSSITAISFQLEVLGRVTTFDALPPRSATPLGRTEAVLVYLEKAEQKEIDPWLRDDLRIAWITTLYAARGNCQAHTDATYRVLGCHPAEVWDRIVASRKAQLGPLYAQFWGENLPPKKPARSVALEEFWQQSNAA